MRRFVIGLVAGAAVAGAVLDVALASGQPGGAPRSPESKFLLGTATGG
jgi:hypothetical protein